MSLFDKDKGRYQIISEELNIEEHFFFRNTIARKIRAGDRMSFEGRQSIHGSYWKNLDRFHVNPERVFDSLNQLPEFSYQGVMSAVLDTQPPDNRTIVVKYPSNVLFLRRVMQEFPDAQFCLLVRDLKGILKSKINDEQMRILREHSRIRYFIKRLSVLAFFVFDHVNLSRSARKLKHHENVFIINYSEISKDRDCLKDLGLVDPDVDLFDNVQGKKSSLHGNVRDLNLFEKAVAFCFE